MPNTQDNADGKFVVIKNGTRVTAPTANPQEAQKEAERLNRLAEAQGQKNPAPAVVKQNLFG